MLVVTLNSQKVELFLNEYQKDENAFDRVVEYLVESSRISINIFLSHNNYDLIMTFKND